MTLMRDALGLLEGAAEPSEVDARGWRSCIVLLAQNRRSYARLWHLQLDVYAPLWLIQMPFSFSGLQTDHSQ